MYNNIGKKIKGLAIATFIIGALGTFITGISLMSIDEDLLAIGLPIMLAGPLFAWISSWALYGFGELIDQTSKIAKNMSENPQKESTILETKEDINHNPNVVYCPNCGKEMTKDGLFCTECGTKI